MYRLLDLFSGIGGFSLGLERTGGFRTVGFVEINEFCQRVLRKHWPNVPIDSDISQREFREGEADVITGGFPCQDISNAGERAGLAGERSGLWRDLLRAVRVVRPKYAIVENVAALLNRGMGEVLGDLAEIGRDAEWHCIPASAVGAEHDRDRVWIVADTMRQGFPPRGASREDRTDASIIAPGIGPSIGASAPGLERRGASRWGGDVHGIPDRAHRIGALGNAVVPQIPEIIGRAILAADNEGG